MFALLILIFSTDENNSFRSKREILSADSHLFVFKAEDQN